MTDEVKTDKSSFNKSFLATTVVKWWIFGPMLDIVHPLTLMHSHFQRKKKTEWCLIAL